MHTSRLTTAALFFSLILVSLPLALFAQTDPELESTVRAAIMSDSRAAQMSEEEIEQMVAVLVQSASEQGVSASDIEWRPQETVFVAEEEAVVDDSCGIFPAFFCALSAAFGLDGSDMAIPIMLGITAGILLFVIGAILLHRHGRHPIVGKFANAVPSNPSPRVSQVPQSAPPPVSPPPASQGSSLYQ